MDDDVARGRSPGPRPRAWPDLAQEFAVDEAVPSPAAAEAEGAVEAARAEEDAAAAELDVDEEWAEPAAAEGAAAKASAHEPPWWPHRPRSEDNEELAHA